MAKPRETPITGEDINEYLASRSDFDLELFVYRCANAAGMEVSHGGTYDDPATNKPRQYDVRAVIDSPSGLTRRIAMAIECKALQPSFPLVISRVPRGVEESYHELAFSEEVNLLETSVFGRSLRLDGRSSIYRTGSLVGKSTTQVGRSEKGEFVAGDAEVYDKWAQALASASDLVSDAMDIHSRTGAVTLSLVLPVLVVSDQTLWVADYSAEGVMTAAPHQVDEATIYIGRAYSDRMQATYVCSHLWVFTRSAVAQWLSTMSDRTAGLWRHAFDERAVTIALASEQ